MLNLNTNVKLGSYLAGLIEGDGTVFVPVTFRNKKGRINYAYISICFTIKDLKLAEKLQSMFGGNLKFNKSNTYVIWIIYKIDLLVILINVIGPFFRTYKLNKLNSLINYLNINFNHLLKNVKLNNFEMDSSNIQTNAWLSGFADANGNFNILISSLKKVNKKRISISFRLELKKDESYFSICNKLSSFFCVSLYVRERKQKDNIFYAYLIVAHSMKSHVIVCNYFDNFPLYSSKYLNYLDWKKIYLLQIEQKHLTKEGFDLCINIKNTLNNKRAHFNWDHLDNFYAF